MTNTQLPPQAYTRETLAHAYEWLKSQPISVREMAKDADTLVAFYLQSKRRDLHQQRSFQTDPVSSKSFKSDLRTLAEGIKQFDQAPTTKSNDDRTEILSEPNLADLSFSVEPQGLGAVPPAKTQPHKASVSTSSSGLNNSLGSFDSRTQAAINFVRDRFNLSTDQEALRLLVAMGIEQIQSRF